MRHGIVDSRKASRGAGVARLKQELRTLGQALKKGGTALHHEISRDLFRAHRTSINYGRSWLKKALSVTVGEPAERANAETIGSVRRIGVTESSEAFSSGRTAILRIMPAGAAGSDGGWRQFLRIWDANLDARVCPYCFGMHGTIVGIHEPFPGGEPGAIHPWDRCGFTLVSSAESDHELEMFPIAGGFPKRKL